MIGRHVFASYAATLTAFIVNVVPRFMPTNTPAILFLISWILPGVLAGFAIARLNKYYRQKFTKPSLSVTLK
ncbi:MAG: hypothetical protein QM669_08040 [Siphonobacter sp.]